MGVKGVKGVKDVKLVIAQINIEPVAPEITNLCPGIYILVLVV